MNEYYKTIDSGNMFDFKDYYDKIALSLPDNANLIEVGLANGMSIVYMASKLKDINKKATLYGADNMDYGNKEQLNTILNHIIKSGSDINLLTLGSLDTSCKFPDNTLDFVFIDSSHYYEQTKAEIRLWIRKVKVGGILAGHDYLCNKGVNDAVNEIVPPEFRTTIQTQKNYGIWQIVKQENTVIL